MQIILHGAIHAIHAIQNRPRQNSWRDKEWNKLVPLTEVTSFAFSSFFILMGGALTTCSASMTYVYMYLYIVTRQKATIICLRTFPNTVRINRRKLNFQLIFDESHICIVDINSLTRQWSRLVSAHLWNNNILKYCLCFWLQSPRNTFFYIFKYFLLNFHITVQYIIENWVWLCWLGPELGRMRLGHSSRHWIF